MFYFPFSPPFFPFRLFPFSDDFDDDVEQISLDIESLNGEVAATLSIAYDNVPHAFLGSNCLSTELKCEDDDRVLNCFSSLALLIPTGLVDNVDMSKFTIDSNSNLTDQGVAHDIFDLIGNKRLLMNIQARRIAHDMVTLRVMSIFDPEQYIPPVEEENDDRNAR